MVRQKSMMWPTSRWIEAHHGQSQDRSSQGRHEVCAVNPSRIHAGPPLSGASTTASPRTRGETVPAHRTRLLLVEDEAGIRFALREFLVSSGFEVSEADSCETALQAVRASMPDLVLLDFVLPDGDAFGL